jgi:hypothetical protein
MLVYQRVKATDSKSFSHYPRALNRRFPKKVPKSTKVYVVHISSKISDTNSAISVFLVFLEIWDSPHPIPKHGSRRSAPGKLEEHMTQ